MSLYFCRALPSGKLLCTTTSHKKIMEGVIIEGFLHKRGRYRGEMVRRWYRLLDSGQLVWAQDKQSDVKGSLWLKSETTLGPGAEYARDELYGFALADKGRSRELLAPSRGDRELWLHGLCCVIAALGNDVEAVRDVRRRALRYASLAAEAGDDCLRALLDAPLPGEQHDVDLERLFERGLVVAGRADCKKWGTKFMEKDFELSKEGELSIFDIIEAPSASGAKASSTGASSSGRVVLKRTNSAMKRRYAAVDVSAAELVVSRTDSHTVSYQTESTFVSVKCRTLAQRNDLVFASAVVGEIHRRLDTAVRLAEAKRRQFPVVKSDNDDDAKKPWLVCSLTWNVNEKEVEARDLSTVVDAVLPRSTCPDILVVGLQEATAKLTAFVNAERKFSKWDEALRAVLPKDLVLFESACVGPTRIAVYLHRRNLSLVAQLKPDAVAVGAGGLPNKGAAAVAFYARNAKVVFVAAHLAAHAERADRRDTDARRIDAKLLRDDQPTDTNAQRLADRQGRGRLYSLPSRREQEEEHQGRGPEEEEEDDDDLEEEEEDDDDDDDEEYWDGPEDHTTSQKTPRHNGSATPKGDNGLPAVTPENVSSSPKKKDAVEALRVARTEAVIDEETERLHLRTLAETRLKTLVDSGAISADKYKELLQQMRDYWKADDQPAATRDDDELKQEQTDLPPAMNDADDNNNSIEEQATKPLEVSPPPPPLKTPRSEKLSLFPPDPPPPPPAAPVEEKEATPAEAKNKATRRRKNVPSRLCANHSAVLWMGDLNYRVDVDRAEAERLIDLAFGTGMNGNMSDRDRETRRKYALDALLAHDQLLPRLADPDSGFPRGFKEQPITFAPTFKFDPGTNTYDTSQKQRVPAWCDRVLYAGPIVQPVAYGSVPDAMPSDHRPVFAQFHFNLDDAGHSPDQSWSAHKEQASQVELRQQTTTKL